MPVHVYEKLDAGSRWN